MNLDQIQDESLEKILNAFLMGIRFDLVICSYILALPFLVFSILTIIGKSSNLLIKSMHYLIVGLFSVSFVVSSIDVPWFNQFYTRLNMSVFLWLDHPKMVFGMIAAEPRYWFAIVPLVLIIWLFAKFTSKIVYSNTPKISPKKWLVPVISTVVGLAFIMLAIRGRIESKSPIRVGTAFFSSNAFLNQLGLNPNFTLIRSFLDAQNPENSRINFMNTEEAFIEVKNHLSREGQTDSNSLMVCHQRDSVSSKKPNIILVLMESMSARKMNHYGSEDDLTPFLDSISANSIRFDSIYTAGIHTYNGIFSTLFSFPALFLQHPMKKVNQAKYHGLPHALKSLDYSTAYFTTHDGQFDNAEGFLMANSVDFVFSQEDYPSEQVTSTLGVPDDYMFEFSIPILDSLSMKQGPFFATFMTASDHGPYIVPDYFKPHSSGEKKQIVEYADWSLKQLVDGCRDKSWFNNTVFVFVADHGNIWGTSDYPMPLSYHHSPFIIYGPDLFVEPNNYGNVGGQIDVFPTLLSVLDLPFCNQTLGIDLTTEKRDYIYFCADDRYGVIGKEFYLIVNSDGSKMLFNIKKGDKIDYAKALPDVVAEMDTYARAQFQVAQELMDPVQLIIDN